MQSGLKISIEKKILPMALSYGENYIMTSKNFMEHL